MRSASLALAFGSLLASASPVQLGASSTLTITNKVISPDGFSRSAVVVNGIFPGPVVTGNKGDTFNLNVVNNLKDTTMLRSTSVHWQSVYQERTDWADGVNGVSQCPISPDHSFMYQFTVADQAGTFLYRSHFGTQYCDGLRGPMVVYDPNDPQKSLYDIDDASTVITLADWYHLPAPVVQQEAVALADATLINGKGRYEGGPNVDLAVVNVQKGKRYRFRLMSISCDSNFIFSIDGHQLTIIEADSEAVIPHTVDSLSIFAGQRYSFVLNANQPVNNYWVRALPSSGKGNLPISFAGGLNSAILRYRGAPVRDPTSSQTNGSLLSESDLAPLTNPAAPGGPFPGGADLTFNLTLRFDELASRYFIGDKSWVPPDAPVLLQILSGAQNAQDLLPEGLVITLPKNKVIEVNMPGKWFGGPHPMHLHGHSFSVIKSAGINSTVNYANPVRRDVVATSTESDTVTIRFVTDNTGPWFFHCNVDWHLTRGLGIVFAEDITGTPTVPVPNSWKELCPIYDSLPASETSISFAPTSTAN